MKYGVDLNPAYRFIEQLRGNRKLIDANVTKTSNYHCDYVHVFFVKNL